MARTVPVENTGSVELVLLEGRKLAVLLLEALEDVVAKPLGGIRNVPEGIAVPRETERLNVPFE